MSNINVVGTAAWVANKYNVNTGGINTPRLRRAEKMIHTPTEMNNEAVKITISDEAIQLALLSETAKDSDNV